MRLIISVRRAVDNPISTDASEILLYTQVDVYAYPSGGEFKLIKSKRFEGEDMER